MNTDFNDLFRMRDFMNYIWMLNCHLENKIECFWFGFKFFCSDVFSLWGRGFLVQKRTLVFLRTEFLQKYLGLTINVNLAFF